MDGSSIFQSKVFVGTWTSVAGSSPGDELDIRFENERFWIVQAGLGWDTGCAVNFDNATLENDDISVSYWKCDKTEPRIMGMMIERAGGGSGLRFGEPDGTRYSVWGCELEKQGSTHNPPVFDPSFDPKKFLNKKWHVVVEHGDSGGRMGYWVRITRCLPRSRVLALSASWCENGPWQLYDVLFYDRQVGSLESIFQHRSLCFWPKGKRSKNVIYAMFDSRTVGSSARSQEIRLMPFEQLILDWTDGTGGAGVWGAEEGGGG